MEVNVRNICTLKELRTILADTDELVMVYFYSDWSPPCRRIRFEFAQAVTRNSHVIYIQANMDQAKAIWVKLGISLDDIPALASFVDGSLVNIVKNITPAEFDNFDFPVDKSDSESADMPVQLSSSQATM